MVETVLTPPHPDPFEAWLDKPFAGTLNHPTANGQAQVLIGDIVDVIPVALQIRIDRPQGVPCRREEPLYV